MKIISFTVSYSRLLLGVMLGQRETRYPLGVFCGDGDIKDTQIYKPDETIINTKRFLQ